MDGKKGERPEKRDTQNENVLDTIITTITATTITNNNVNTDHTSIQSGFIIGAVKKVLVRQLLLPGWLSSKAKHSKTSS